MMQFNGKITLCQGVRCGFKSHHPQWVQPNLVRQWSLAPSMLVRVQLPILAPPQSGGAGRIGPPIGPPMGGLGCSLKVKQQTVNLWIFSNVGSIPTIPSLCPPSPMAMGGGPGSRFAATFGGPHLGGGRPLGAPPSPWAMGGLPSLLPMVGFEPTRKIRLILNQLSLPIPPQGHPPNSISGGPHGGAMVGGWPIGPPLTFNLSIGGLINNIQ